MPVPILSQGPYLIASVQTALTDSDLRWLQDGLLEEAGRRRSRGVIVDVSVLDVMDSFATRTLRSLVSMLRLRGVETVLVGIQPSVAIAMVQLGLAMADVVTALDLDDGLAYLHSLPGEHEARGN
jgi:rsbT antagonist protein RsbS